MKKIFKLKFTLDQVVAMIHFQGDEAGATLRATDVKPKFDRFLYRCIAKEFNIKLRTKSAKDQEDSLITTVKEYLIKNHKSWLIEPEAKHHALNYRVRIFVNPSDIVKDEHGTLIESIKGKPNQNKTKNYFGAANYVLKETINGRTVVKRDGEGVGVHKVGNKYKNIKVEMMCFDEVLSKLIEKYFPVFMIATGFGYASGKGYGSFVVKEVMKDGNISAVYNSSNSLTPLKLIKEYQNIMNYHTENILLYMIKDEEAKGDELDRLGDIVEINRYIKSGYNFPMKDKYYPSPLMKDYFKQGTRKNLINEKSAMKNVAIKAGVRLKTNRRPYSKEVKKVPYNAKRVYTRGLFGLAAEYKYLVVDNRDGLTFSVAAQTSDGRNFSRFANPITYRIIRNGDEYQIIMIVDVLPVKTLQELKPNVIFSSNYKSVESVHATIPSTNEFSMKEYLNEVLLKKRNRDEDFFYYLCLVIEEMKG